MKCLFLVALAAALLLPDPVRAEGPDDKYIEIYKLIQEGDQFAASSQNDFARQKYLEAQMELKKLQASYPTWNEKLIQFRLNTLEGKLGAATNAAARVPESAAPKSTAPSTPAMRTAPPIAAPPMRTAPPVAPPVVKTEPPVAPPVAVTPQPDLRDQQIRDLRSQVGQLQSEKTALQSEKNVLESKLREALKAQPAAIDPRELARAEERIRALEKEKEVLKVSADVADAKAAQAGRNASPEMTRELEAAKRKLAEQNDIIVALRLEKQVLEKNVETAKRSGEEVLTRLRAENETLRKQLTDKGALVQAAPGSNQAEKELASTKSALQSTRDTVASLQVRLRKLEEERDRLDKTRKDLESKLASSSVSGSESSQIKRLQKEKEELQKRLNDTARQLADTKSSAKPSRSAPVEDVSGLRARLEVLEARRVPYTVEELALFKKPDDGALVASAALEPKAEANSGPGVSVLLADAQRAFTARRFDEAEKKYQEAIRLDGKNVSAFQKLAAAQLEQNHPKDAEVTLKRALEQNPSDPRALLLMGIAKFDQEKFDEALDVLSRSAQLDAQNPETQNYLGITLSQKGQRAAAETALRKAIQIDPGYKSAHYNLAVIYATQQPPFVELARWHYQKALAYGHAANPELEKVIEKKQSTPQK